MVKAITRLVVSFSAAELELSQAIPSHSDQIADKLPPIPSYPASHPRTTNRSKRNQTEQSKRWNGAAPYFSSNRPVLIAAWSSSFSLLDHTARLSTFNFQLSTSVPTQISNLSEVLRTHSRRFEPKVGGLRQSKKSKLDEFRTNNIALLKELNELKQKFEGVNPEEVCKLAEEKQRLEAGLRPQVIAVRPPPK